MPQSLTQFYVHLIFSTKHREACLSREIRDELYPYFAKVLINLDCNAKSIGGTADHMHILCSLSKNLSAADLVEEIKKPTSKWLKTKSSKLKNFHWQSGYAGFSVSYSGIERVRQYILNQEEHHKTRSFQDELRAFLRKHKVEFDERYLWD